MIREGSYTLIVLLKFAVIHVKLGVCCNTINVVLVVIGCLAVANVSKKLGSTCAFKVIVILTHNLKLQFYL